MIHNKEYFCYKLNQRGVPESTNFAVFLASSKDVNRWAGIKRVGEDDQGSQRILKETRVKAIKRFLTKDVRNTIPVSAILAFNPGTAQFNSLKNVVQAQVQGDLDNGIGNKMDWGKLTFSFDDTLPDNEKPALIVDGQHRIKGMASLENEDVPVLIVALLDAAPQEQAFQFVVINNKSQKVPTDNVKAIISILGQEEVDLGSRLMAAGVNYGKISATLADINEEQSSPFNSLLKWPATPDGAGFVELTTIENSIRYIKTQLPIIKEDDETIKELFMAMWRAIKVKYPDLWASTKQETIDDVNKAKFMSKVNINALNEYITDKVGNAWLDDKFNLFVMSEVERFCVDVALRQIGDEFWKAEWTFKLQDNAIVRNKIKEEMTRITQNVKSDKEWYDGLSIVAQL